MTRSESLPLEVTQWLRRVSREELRRRLATSITERAAIAGLRLDAATLATDVEGHDARYFDAQEHGRDEEAMREFKCARLLSSQRFLVDGEDDEALFEFFHSLDDATPEALFTALKPG